MHDYDEDRTVYAVLSLKQNLRSTYCSEANDRHEARAASLRQQSFLLKVCWCCLLKIIKISPCLSKLQLAEFGAFFETQLVYKYQIHRPCTVLKWIRQVATLRAHSIGQPGHQPVTNRWPVANGTQLGDQSVTDRRPEIARPPYAGASSLPWISKNRPVIFTPTVRNALQCVLQFRCVLLSAIRGHSELVPLPTKFTSINTIRHWTKILFNY